MAVQEEQKPRNESIKAVKVKESFLDKNNGFIPPSKQAKMKRESQAKRASSSDRSAQSQRSAKTRISRSKSSVGAGITCLHCHDIHPHDANGHCLPVPEVGLAAARKRLIGIKPPKCDNSGDGIFIKKSRKPLTRSKTR